MDPECSVMEGRLTLYLVDKSYESEMTQLAREYIKAMMNDGLLDNASPAILGVSFIDDQVRGFVDRDIILNEDDDLEEPDVTIFAVGQNIWIAIGSSLFGVVVIGSALRYRYSSQFDDHGDRIDNEEPSENYSEFRPVTPQNDIETSQVFDDSTGRLETELDNSNRLEVETEVNESPDDILPALPTSLLNDTEGSMTFDVFDIIDANADRIVVEDDDESLEAASFSC